MPCAQSTGRATKRVPSSSLLFYGSSGHSTRDRAKFTKIVNIYYIYSSIIIIIDPFQYIPAICSVALRLKTFPAAFLATHQYTPPSCSFLPCTVRRKNSEPDGNRTRCDLLSFGLVLTGSPSLNHSMLGSGRPSALQFRVTGSFFGTTMSLGCSVMRGVRY